MDPELKQKMLSTPSKLTELVEQEAKIDCCSVHLWSALAFIRGCDSMNPGSRDDDFLKNFTTERVRRLLGFHWLGGEAPATKEEISRRDALIILQPGHWRSHWRDAVSAIRELKGWDLDTEQPWPAIPPTQVPEIQVYLQQQKDQKLL